MKRFGAGVLLCALAGCGANNGVNGPTTDNFGEAQVMGLAVTLSDHQVQVAMGALERGLVRSDVQAYATRLAAEQAAARDHFLAVAQATGIAVDTSTVEAQSHVTDTMQDIQLLQPPVPDSMVDSIYLADSVYDVQKALEIYNASLLPFAHTPALVDALNANTPVLMDTVARGQQIESQAGITPK